MNKIKYAKRIEIEYKIERYPQNCKECPCFSQHPYSCMNERGTEARCELGYMDRQDMRDFSGGIKYSKCMIEKDDRVKII